MNIIRDVRVALPLSEHQNNRNRQTVRDEFLDFFGFQDVNGRDNQKRDAA